MKRIPLFHLDIVDYDRIESGMIVEFYGAVAPDITFGDAGDIFAVTYDNGRHAITCEVVEIIEGEREGFYPHYIAYKLKGRIKQ